MGGSGSGKSTLIRLLYRFFEPNQGTIKIGNDDINQEVSGVSITTVRPATTTSLAPRRTTTEKPQPTSIRGRVKCHQCGSLFAGV